MQRCTLCGRTEKQHYLRDGSYMACWWPRGTLVGQATFGLGQESKLIDHEIKEAVALMVPVVTNEILEKLK